MQPAGSVLMLGCLTCAVRDLHSGIRDEFLEHHLVRSCGAARAGLTLSHSRPHQRNDASVQAQLGRALLETPAHRRRSTPSIARARTASSSTDGTDSSTTDTRD